MAGYACASEPDGTLSPRLACESRMLWIKDNDFVRQERIKISKKEGKHESDIYQRQRRDSD
jgi:hypothetical protein